MKITISIPKEVYGKLERDRGVIPRSTYIQQLIKDNDEMEEDEELPTEEEEGFKTYFKK